MAERWGRARWAVRPLRAGLIGPQQHVYVHHTAGRCGAAFDACLRQYEDFHIGSRGMVNIAYGKLTPTTGLIVADGRGFGRSGGHTAGWNTTSNAVCSDDNHEHAPAGDRLVEAIAQGIVDGIRDGHVRPNPIIGGHRDVYPTACPGRHLYARLPDIRALVARGGAPAPVPLPKRKRSRMFIKIRAEAGRVKEHWRAAQAGMVVPPIKMLQMLDQGWCEMYLIEYEQGLAGQLVGGENPTAGIGRLVPAR